MNSEDDFEAKEWFGPIAVNTSEIKLEKIGEMTSEDAKQILINTFDDASIWMDDESTFENGYTICFSSEGIGKSQEEKVEALVEKISKEVSKKVTLLDIASEAATATGHIHKLGTYTNVCMYFFSENEAQDWLNKMREAVKAL